MKTNRIIVHVVIVVLMVLLVNSAGYSEEIQYVTKVDFICGDTKIEIATRYFKFTPDDPPNREGQQLTFTASKSGKTIITRPSGLPFDKDLEATSATYYQCLKGKKASYLILTYNTGGNCNECTWQGILDMQGNRVAVDRHKKQKASFERKLKELGLPNSAALGDIDFGVIPKELDEQK
ncbi:MAG: hypothetical protein GJV46_04680 [Geobacter sp.]|nr:hypothetical protein [Geobacter sp.]